MNTTLTLQPASWLIRRAFQALIIFLLSAFPTLLKAQDDAPWPQPGKESVDYSEYRQKISIPPYGLAKVQALVKNMESGENGEMAISARAYQSLSLREKFTYHMTNGEADNQNCDVQPPIIDEHKKIFGHLPDFFGDAGWSLRQQKFFVQYKDTVLALIRESTLRSKHMGANYKQAIVDLNAVEMIPFVINAYHVNPKDHDMLTILLLLMSEGKYPPFLQTPMYKKLYGEQSDYRSFLVFNAANETLIISRAMDFYNAKKH